MIVLNELIINKLTIKCTSVSSIREIHLVERSHLKTKRNKLQLSNTNKKIAVVILPIGFKASSAASWLLLFFWSQKWPYLEDRIYVALFLPLNSDDGETSQSLTYSSSKVKKKMEKLDFFLRITSNIE